MIFGFAKQVERSCSVVQSSLNSMCSRNLLPLRNPKVHFSCSILPLRHILRYFRPVHITFYLSQLHFYTSSYPKWQTILLWDFEIKNCVGAFVTKEKKSRRLLYQDTPWLTNLCHSCPKWHAEFTAVPNYMYVEAERLYTIDITVLPNDDASE